MSVQVASKPNPWQHNFSAKSLVPNFDAAFETGYPAGLFDSSPWSAMRRKPGINHPWIYAAISTIISSYVQCPLRLFSKRDPKKELIDDHPILKLLKQPNPHMSGSNFLEAIVWNLSLSTSGGTGGTCFIFGEDKCNFRRGDMPEELWLQADDQVTAIVDAQKILQAWRFDYKDGVSPYDYGMDMRKSVQEVIRVNYFNPHNYLKGVAPGYSLRAAIGQDASAGELNTSLIASGGQMRGVFTAKKPMTIPQMEEYKANLKKHVGGRENAGQFMHLPWEMEFNQLSLTPEEMNYMEQLGWNRDQVMAVHKVSKFALQQYEDLNYATAKEAKRQLFDQAILPTNSLIMQEINQGWLDNYKNGDLQLTIDLSNVSALHDDLDARWKRADMAVQMGIPPLIALKMNEIATDDLKAFAWLMENQSPNAMFAKPDPADDGEDPKDPKDAKKPGKGLKKKSLTHEDRRRISADHIAKVRIPGEQEVFTAVRRVYTQQKNKSLAMVDAWEKITVAAEGTHPDRFSLDKNKEDAAIRLALAPSFKNTAKRSLKWTREDIARVLAESKASTTEDADAQVKDDIDALIRTRLHRLAAINTTTFGRVTDQVADVLVQSVKDELSVADTAKALREAITEVYGGRANEAMNVAITETGTISTSVQHTAMKAAGIEYKQWLASHVQHYRPTHQADEEAGPIPFDSNFPNTGLAYPLQDGAPPSEVCYCHCCLVAARPPEE